MSRLPGRATVETVLLAGVVVSTSLYVRSETARQRAEAEARRGLLEAEALQAGLLNENRQYAALSREAMQLHRSLLAEGGADLALYAVNRFALLYEFVDDKNADEGHEREREELNREVLELVVRSLSRGDPEAVKWAAILADELSPGEAAPLARRALARLREGTAGSDPSVVESRERLVEPLQRCAIGPNAADDGAAQSSTAPARATTSEPSSRSRPRRLTLARRLHREEIPPLRTATWSRPKQRSLLASSTMHCPWLSRPGRLSARRRGGETISLRRAEDERPVAEPEVYEVRDEAAKPVSEKLCKDCGAVLVKDDVFCPICGARVPLEACLSCGAKPRPDDKFCRKCGFKIG